MKPYFDKGPHYKGQIGFLAVANADLTERDMFRMKPDGVGVHFSRVLMPEICNMESLTSLEDGIDDAVSVLMPARDDLDVICFNCTAGSFAVGEDVIVKKINSLRPNVKATTLFTGVLDALNHLNVKNLAVGTAYDKTITDLEGEVLEANGFNVTTLQGLSLKNDQEMNCLSPDFLYDFALSLNTEESDAIFISCGALRCLDVVESIEKEINKPVICSNQASMWHCLRLAGCYEPTPGLGMLFRS